MDEDRLNQYRIEREVLLAERESLHASTDIPSDQKSQQLARIRKRLDQVNLQLNPERHQRNLENRRQRYQQADHGNAGDQDGNDISAQRHQELIEQLSSLRDQVNRLSQDVEAIKDVLSMRRNLET